MNSRDKTVARLQGHIARFGREYPKIWKEVDHYRAALREISPWPDWCFMPIAGYIAILTKGRPIEKGPPDESYIQAVSAAEKLAGLTPWKTTQGIYWFHPGVLKEVISTPLEGRLPTELFFRLPEWCIYIPCEGDFADREKFCGFFTYLEYDVNNKEPELHFLIDTSAGFFPIILHLSKDTIEEAVTESIRLSIGNVRRYGLDSDFERAMPEIQRLSIEKARQFVSLVLYICSVNADFFCRQDPSRRPSLPRGKRVKGGEVRFFPPKCPVSWDVGYHIGAALEAGRTRPAVRGDKTHASPRPHIRRAHCHSYRVGPLSRPEQRKVVVRWLHSILVGNREGIKPAL